MENHELVHLNEWGESIGFFSLQSPRILIIFVHGFGGQSVDTWADFKIILRNHSLFTDSDIIFYGYDSKFIQATTNASLLRTFLEEICKPQEYLNDVKRTVPANYEKIIFMAHSLGAFIVRKALIHAHKNCNNWIDNVKMILLAPAHNGSELPQRVMEILPGLLKTTAQIARYFMPVLEDLQKGSSAITTLKDETMKLLAEGKGGFTIANRVDWAEFERVVINDDFCSDPVADTIRGKDHISICKAELNTYELPVERLKKLI